MKDKVKCWYSNRSVGELIDMVQNYELIPLNSDLLEADKISFFIESVVLGFPLRPIYTLEIEANQAKILDGHLELNTLNAFIEGKIRLEGVITEDLAGMKYKDLITQGIRRIKRESLCVREFYSGTIEKYSESFLREYCQKIMN